MKLWNSFWNDECGAVLSAEAVLLGAMTVVGATAGLKMTADSIEGEIADTAYSIRSLDQSYTYSGYANCRAATAGSVFVQRPAAESVAELKARYEAAKEAERKEAEKNSDAPKVEPKKKKLKPKKEKESDETESKDSIDEDLRAVGPLLRTTDA